MLSPVESAGGDFVTATKSILFQYDPSEELSQLFEDFRSMCNDAIRVAVQEEPKNKFELTRLAYKSLKAYGLHTNYILNACQVAYSAYKNKNRKSVPYVKKAFLRLGSQAYLLNYMLLRIPTTPKKYIFITLKGSSRHFSFINDHELKRGAVTITPDSVIIAFSKSLAPLKPEGFMGVDTNEKNATVSATDGYYSQFTELGEVAEIKERYKETMWMLSKLTRVDRRVGKQLQVKYGRRERRRTASRVHKVTSQIVRYGREHKFGVKMEKLTGIRKLYRKGNGQGTSFRGRMNTWVFGETQRQIDYKARWEGVPVWYVNPRGTSSYCPCGSRVTPLADRKLYCQKCDKTWDRDDLASKNIMACAVPQDRPSRGGSEGEPRKQEDAGNPRSGWREGSAKGSDSPKAAQNLHASREAGSQESREISP